MTSIGTSGRFMSMLKIRLARVGRKNDPSFRVVVTESQRGPKSNDHVEMLGNYNPKLDSVTLNGERILHWIGNGAQVSDTVHNLLVKEGVIKGEKKNVLPKKSPILKEEAEEKTEEESTEAPVEEAGEEADTKEVTEEAKEEEKVEEKPEEKPEEKEEEKTEEKVEETTEGEPKEEVEEKKE